MKTTLSLCAQVKYFFYRFNYSTISEFLDVYNSKETTRPCEPAKVERSTRELTYRRTSLFNRPPSNPLLPSVHSLFAPCSLAPCSLAPCSSLALTSAVSRQKLKMPHQSRLRTRSCAFPGLLSPSSLISYDGNFGKFASSSSTAQTINVFGFVN